MNPRDAQSFREGYRFERKKVGLAAADTTDSVGDCTDHFVQGRRYEQWIAGAPMKRWDETPNLSRLSILPQWLR